MEDDFNPMDVAGFSAAAAERQRRLPASEEPVGNVAASQLRSFIEWIERLEEEKKEVADFIKDVFGEAKATGFDPKALRKILAIRKKGVEKWQEEDMILDTYLSALGMLETGQ